MLEHGDGAWVWDVEGRRYLDLVGGIAVNALGHNHPALVAAVSKQAGQLVHVSNFFTSVPQVELAERLLSLAGAPAGSKVFFCNSGAEALEAAIKLARRTGRTGLVAAEGAFHGRTTGALALTHKPAYRAAVRAAHPRRDARALGRRRRPARRRHRADLGARARADPGRGRRAPRQLRLPARRPRDHPRGRRAARARRGADRHRPHRHVVRLPPGRCRARRDDPGQGPGRRRADRRPDDLRPRRQHHAHPRACTARPSAATRWPAPPGWPCSTPSPPRGCSTTPARPASTSSERIGDLGAPAGHRHPRRRPAAGHHAGRRPLRRRRRPGPRRRLHRQPGRPGRHPARAPARRHHRPSSTCSSTPCPGCSTPPSAAATTSKDAR